MRKCAEAKRGVFGWCCAVAVMGLGMMGARSVRAAEPGAAILQDLKRFGQMGSVLMIAAHPDDENTQLLTYLARGPQYRTAYLSMTRGDGGQNLLGPEFGEELGLIRTQELLAARRLDGARQFFTRALDFGFSKNADETLRIWDRQQVLSDVVRVMREFRPDVVVLRFSPQNTNTHGHHTASAILGFEAYGLAGDPKAFPDQVKELGVWQPKRLLVNAGGNGAVVRMEAGGTDVVLGETFGDIAGRSRGMHKSQGFGNAGAGGGRGGGGGAARTETFQLVGGEAAEKDIMEGVDLTWKRVGPGGAEIAGMVEKVIGGFDGKNPAASVPGLLEIKRKVAVLPADRLVDEKRGDLDRLIQRCLGLTLETTVAQAEVAAGETMPLRHRAVVTASVPVTWVGIKYGTTGAESKVGAELKANQEMVREGKMTVPVGTPVSQPYWLREEPGAGIFKVADTGLIGRPENRPVFPVEATFEVGGETIRVLDEPVQVIAGPTGEVRRRVEVVAGVSVQFPLGVRVFTPGASRTVTVGVTAYRADAAGRVMLSVPAGWKVAPAERAFALKAVGEQMNVTFEVTAPPGAASGEIAARAESNGQVFDTSRKEITYTHIPPLLLQPKARLKAVSFDLAVRGKKIGYVAGAGDSVAECLGEMGYEVKSLTGKDLTAEGLKGLDAVVIGVRAFNTRDDLAGGMKALFDYVEQGGTVVEQYNRPDGLKTQTLAPYSLRLGPSRITDEGATVTLLKPEHPVLNVPNKITAADFGGWVQERGIYFPAQWGEQFVPILSAGDPGEAALEGGLLVAQHGKGYFVYTGLVFFRELPAGVPGAYRLFANMVSLGKP